MHSLKPKKQPHRKLKTLDVGQIECFPDNLAAAYAAKGVIIARQGVVGDGTCFFHSLCAALNLENYNYKSEKDRGLIGRKFRCAFTADITLEKWKDFLNRHDAAKVHTHYHNNGKPIDSAFLKKLKSWFCNGRRWADEMMIKYVGEVLHLNLMFIDGNTGRMYCGVRGPSNVPVVVIVWIDHMHFEPMLVVVEHNADKKLLRAKFKLHHTLDAKIIESLLTAYDDMCPVAPMQFSQKS